MQEVDGFEPLALPRAVAAIDDRALTRAYRVQREARRRGRIAGGIAMLVGGP